MVVQIAENEGVNASNSRFELNKALNFTRSLINYVAARVLHKNIDNLVSLSVKSCFYHSGLIVGNLLIEDGDRVAIDDEVSHVIRFKIVHLFLP